MEIAGRLREIRLLMEDHLGSAFSKTRLSKRLLRRSKLLSIIQACPNISKILNKILRLEVGQFLSFGILILTQILFFNFNFFAKISVFGENLVFLRKFGFLENFRENFVSFENFGPLAKISFFGENFGFWQKFRFLAKISGVWGKFRFLPKILSIYFALNFDNYTGDVGHHRAPMVSLLQIKSP